MEFAIVGAGKPPHREIDSGGGDVTIEPQPEQASPIDVNTQGGDVIVEKQKEDGSFDDVEPVKEDA